MRSTRNQINMNSLIRISTARQNAMRTIEFFTYAQKFQYCHFHFYCVKIKKKSCDKIIPLVGIEHGPSHSKSNLHLYLFLIFLNFGGHEYFMWGQWYPCFWLLVTSPLGFKARVDSALFALGRDICVTCSLRFTSGATPADLLVASMAAEPMSST